MSETATRTAPHGAELKLIDRGDGPPVLILHEGTGLVTDAPFLDRLASQNRVIAPVHPGFDRSERPAEFDSVDDLAYLYLDLLDDMEITTCSLVGFSFGGWIAAELAVRAPHRFDKLVLVDAVGIRVGGRLDRDIADIWALPFDELATRSASNAAVASKIFGFATMSDEAAVEWARNNDTLALYSWQPYMHSPKLRSRLGRVSAQTLVVWGADDGIVTTDYGRCYADSIPGARFEVIDGAAHLPHLDQPYAFAQLVGGFLRS
jgi:pimeloyl-ACP methyl ester carboxylesterase